MEGHFIHGPMMSAQSLDHLRFFNVPHAHEPIGTACTHQIVVFAPRASEQILLEVMLNALESLHAPTLWGKWSDVPHLEGVVHGIRKKEVTIMTQCYPCDSICMAEQ